MREFIFLFFFIFFTGFVSGIRVSPTEISFEEKVGEKSCGNISIFGDGVIIVEDRWSINEERNFLDYDYKSGFFGLDVIYEKEFLVENYSEMDVCVKGKKTDFYSGVLLLRIKDSNEGVGVWMNVNVSDGENILGRISGKIIGESNVKVEGIFLISSFIFLLLLLLVLVIYFRKEKKTI